MPQKLTGANPIQSWSRTRAGCPNLPATILKPRAMAVWGGGCLADQEEAASA